ncbi:MAG: hypothetical protein CFE28_06345 [Alphaproteobacteria bacterium PA2]|nr:MAG: hypothetical protein CFE28_06345 [Alphaproteobacteria bacterium PA2]
MPRRQWMMIAALSGFLAVAVGAFATHGVKDPAAKEWLKTGAQYEFMHTMATFAAAAFMQMGGRRARFAPALFLPGTLLFSGSLYAMAFGAPRWLGMITPIGGLMFLAGWLVLAWAARDIDHPVRSAVAEAHLEGAKET